MISNKMRHDVVIMNKLDRTKSRIRKRVEIRITSGLRHRT